jgi:hypothetical protein
MKAGYDARMRAKKEKEKEKEAKEEQERQEQIERQADPSSWAKRIRGEHAVRQSSWSPLSCIHEGVHYYPSFRP